ncbi:MAG: cytochrome C oxidase subunit IV family protein [Salinirussus sp.]
MVSTRFYTAVYVVLFVFATVQVGIESAGLLEADTYWLAFGLIMLLSAVKAVLVVAYYQHLRFEPRAVTYTVTGALVIALVLTVAAAYSIL